MGERVDGDPLARIAGGAAEKLPRSFRFRRKGAGKVPHAEPADFGHLIGEQPIHDIEDGGGRGWASAALERFVGGLHERQPDAEVPDQARSDAPGAFCVDGVAQAPETAPERSHKCIRVRDQPGQLHAERGRFAEVGGDEGVRGHGYRRGGLGRAGLGLDHRDSAEAGAAGAAAPGTA